LVRRIARSELRSDGGLEAPRSKMVRASA
jgi:hypothetical protein